MLLKLFLARGFVSKWCKEHFSWVTTLLEHCELYTVVPAQFECTCSLYMYRSVCILTTETVVFVLRECETRRQTERQTERYRETDWKTERDRERKKIEREKERKRETETEKGKREKENAQNRKTNIVSWSCMVFVPCRSRCLVFFFSLNVPFSTRSVGVCLVRDPCAVKINRVQHKGVTAAWHAGWLIQYSGWRVRMIWILDSKHFAFPARKAGLFFLIFLKI